MKKVANRKGLNTRLYRYSDKSLFMNIPFGKVTAVDASASRVYATGGQNDGKMVGFDDPAEGTFKITTQIIPIEIIALACSPDGVSEGADWAVREVLKATAGKITLTAEPIVGTLYVYPKNADLDGEPVATTAAASDVTIADAEEGDEYVAYYLKNVKDAKTVTLNNNVTPGTYIIYSDTTYKAEDDTIVAEQIHCYKAMPQKAISLSYQGSGDPASMDLTFDLMEDDNGDVISFTRM